MIGRCVFTVPDQAQPRRKVCAVADCGRVVWHDLPPEMIYADHLPKPGERRPQPIRSGPPRPPALTFEAGLECDKRLKVLGTVPSGHCCGGSHPVRTAGCAVFGVCSEETVADGKRQLVDGVRPHSCVDCEKRSTL